MPSRDRAGCCFLSVIFSADRLHKVDANWTTTKRRELVSKPVLYLCQIWGLAKTSKKLKIKELYHIADDTETKSKSLWYQFPFWMHIFMHAGMRGRGLITCCSGWQAATGSAEGAIYLPCTFLAHTSPANKNNIHRAGKQKNQHPLRLISRSRDQNKRET